MSTSLSGIPEIPERDHVDVMCGVIELIEEHNEEQVKYILGKMCLEMTQLSASLKAFQGESELQHDVKGHQHAPRRQSRGCEDALDRNSTTYGVFSRFEFWGS